MFGLYSILRNLLRHYNIVQMMLTFFFNLQIWLQNLIVLTSCLYSGDHGWPPANIFLIFFSCNCWFSFADKIMELVELLLKFLDEYFFCSVSDFFSEVISLFLKVYFHTKQIFWTKLSVSNFVISFSASWVSWFYSVHFNWLVINWNMFTKNGKII